MIHKYFGIGQRANSFHGTDFICMLFLQFNTKLFIVRINDRKVVITFVATVFLGKFSVLSSLQNLGYLYAKTLYLVILGMNYLVLFLLSLVYL